MNPLSLTIPTIAITGSSGKTTTREFISSIFEQKWKILKNTGNKNLPMNTQQIAQSYDSSIDAIVLELGMGKPGAGENHCQHIQPNISIITNIGTAHYGNLGNSIESTAKNKSVLIKLMRKDGVLLINNDDDHSKLLDTSTFEGSIITVGIKNQADFQAKKVKYQKNGMTFQVILNNQREQFFIPTFGNHNIHNALFAVAIAHILGFTVTEIREGLAKFEVPIKRLNTYELSNGALLIDDTVNANPQSVKAAIDVLQELGRNKKKIVVLGSMLELGDFNEPGHKEVGVYLAQNQVEAVYTLGDSAKWIQTGALEAGFPAEKIKHFKRRDDLHRKLNDDIEKNCVILVKGSSAMNMFKTVQYMKQRYFYSIVLTDNVDKNSIYFSQDTYKHLNIESQTITLHFGKLKKTFKVRIDDKLPLGQLNIPQQLTSVVTIPDLPYDYYFEGDQFHLGPVIGMLVYPRYMNDPNQQLLRFSNYEKVKGLIFLFRPNLMDTTTKTIEGYYYNPQTKSFIEGRFPYPNVLFNRIPLMEKTYKQIVSQIGDKIFNYPYGNTNKLDFWLQNCKQPIIKHHLPRTKEFKNVDGIIKSLTLCDAVYLKPATMAGGNGIYHVKKMNEGYLLTDIQGNQQPILTKEEFAKVLQQKLVKNRTYIIQEEILTFNANQNKIDFRIYIQKDYTQNWRFSGIETKVGNKGSIIANSSNREMIIPGETALQKFYGLTEQQAKDKITEITGVCIRILKIMEKRGSKLGDAAFDLVMDANQKFWILEPQLNYAAEIKANRDEGERRVLPFILPTPFEYAKSLAGF